MQVFETDSLSAGAASYGFIDTAPGDKYFYGFAHHRQVDNVSILSQDTNQTEKLRFENHGTQPMWINWQAPIQNWPQTLRVDAGKAAEYKIPSGEVIPGVRFWPKYGCDSTGQNCDFGESGGPGLPCPPKGCSPPVDSKFEATFGATDGNDWYDASAVDGWTLPYYMEFKCGATGKIDKADCKGLKQSLCPSQDIDGIGNVSLASKNPTKGDSYGGCYSPCAVLTFQNWNNPYGKHMPAAAPADQYCCAGAFQQPEQCKTGPDADMAYTKVVHENCNVYAWAYDDAVGLKACDSKTTQFMIQFFDP